MAFIECYPYLLTDTLVQRALQVDQDSQVLQETQDQRGRKEKQENQGKDFSRLLTIHGVLQMKKLDQEYL